MISLKQNLVNNFFGPSAAEPPSTIETEGQLQGGTVTRAVAKAGQGVATIGNRSVEEDETTEEVTLRNRLWVTEGEAIVIKGRRHQPETIDTIKIVVVALPQQIGAAVTETVVRLQAHVLLLEDSLLAHDYLPVDDHLAGELLLSADSLLLLDPQRKVEAIA